MPTPTPNYLTISYENDAHLLLGRWNRLVMPFEHHAGYLALLDEAMAHRCRYWLIDMTPRRAGLNADDVLWMRETFFPQLPRRLGGVTYFALLMSPHQLVGAVTDPRIADVSFYEQCPYRLMRFTDEAEARAWLEQCRLQDADAAYAPLPEPTPEPEPTAKPRRKSPGRRPAGSRA